MPADMRLASLTPQPRQAFLLVALEGFSEEDAAKILDVDVPTLRSLVEESGRELAAEIATDVLIIEDETFIAMDLETLVESLGHRVLGVARTHTEALALARRRRPGLILADIQLADGSSGLDAVNELLKTFEVPVIFITAYPERFLTGERPEPAFLIAKPFQPAMVSAIASQALFFARNARDAEAAGGLTAALGFDLAAAREQSRGKRTDTGRDREHHQRPVLDLARELAQRLVAESQRVVANCAASLPERAARGRECGPPISPSAAAIVSPMRSNAAGAARDARAAVRLSRASRCSRSSQQPFEIGERVRSRDDAMPLRLSPRCVPRRNGRPRGAGRPMRSVS